MKQRLLLSFCVTAFLCCQFSSLFSQENNRHEQYFIKSPNGKITFQTRTDKISIAFLPTITTEFKRDWFEHHSYLKSYDENNEILSPQFTIGYLEEGISVDSLAKIISAISKDKAVRYCSRYLLGSDSSERSFENSFFVKVQNENQINLLKTYLKLYEISEIENYSFDKSIYQIKVSKESLLDAFEISSLIESLNVFEFASPDFIFQISFNTNDTYYNEQWAINNTGSSQQGNGTPDADMDVDNAWNTTMGSSSIRIAIIDCGVDIGNSDLDGSYSGYGYDATGLGSGGLPNYSLLNNAHGTACAGVVCAEANNGIGVAGIAPNSKYVAVRVATTNLSGAFGNTSSSIISDGVNYAWQTANADILSNSWGGGGYDNMIATALINASSQGRGGKGCPVLVASGNDNSVVNFPASISQIIAVGATDNNDDRASFSNYGTSLDVAAPGVDITTTDVSGIAGYNLTGDYWHNFNGTSAACPMAAGVMALILSVNSNLTMTQARYILESTCEKVGGYSYNSNVSGQPNGTWSQQLGYGRINANQAVLAASNVCSPTQNDFCYGPPVPQPLSVNSSCSYVNGTTCQATQSMAPGSCNSQNGHAYDVWYSFIPTQSTATVTVQSGTGFNAIVEAFITACGTSIQCVNNTGSGGTETLSLSGLTAGNTYYIRVYDYGENANGHTFQICIQSTGGGSTCAMPSGATESNVTQTTADLDWGSVSGAASYTIRYRVSGTSTWSNSFPSSSNSTISSLTCNTTYEWQVRTECTNGLSSSYTTLRTFNTTSCNGSTGDNCSSPIPLTSNTSCSYYTSTVASATSSGITIPSCSGFPTSQTALDVWFSFVATQSTSHTITVDPTGSTNSNNYLDAVIALYSSCSSGSLIDCFDESGSGGVTTTHTFNNLTQGNTYLIRVFDYGSAQPQYGGFDICVYHTPTTSCTTPTNTTETYISQTESDLNWDDVSGVSSYTIRYRVAGGSWQYYSSPNSYYDLTGLICNSTYDWEVRTECTNGSSSSYTNTRTFTTSSCGVTQQVDLTQYQQNASLTVNGNTITISEAIINNGNTTSGGFEIGYYLSTNSNFSTLDYLIGTDYVSNLGAGAIINQDITVDLCNLGIPNGTYYVGYYIDRNGNVSETNESNNLLYWNGGIQISCGSTNQIDLTLNQLNAGYTMSGNSITINDEIINNGTSSSGSFEVGYFLSTSSNFSTLDYFIGSDYITGLSASGSTNQFITVDLCNLGVADGNYYVGFFIDRLGNVNETNESNNVWYWNSPITISCNTIPQVDLTQYQQSANLSVNGNNISISETVINNGSNSAGAFQIGYYLSSSWDFSSLDYFLGSDYITGLSAGATSYQDISLDLCAEGIPDGNYYVGYYIDRTGSIAESNESNNIWYWSNNPVTVSCNTACPVPALLATTSFDENSADLNWSTVANISYYTLWYKESSSSNWIIVTTTNNFYTLSGLNCNTQYDWTIISNCTSGSSSATGPIVTFTTLNCCPTEPILNYPQDGSIIYGNYITFSWYSVANATGYYFEITRDVTFNNIEYSSQSGFNTSGNLTTKDLNTFSQDGTNYYWRVRALGNSCSSSFSPVYNFYSGDCNGTYPPPPILYNPPYASTQYGDTVDFNWSNTGCAFEYERQLATSSSFSASSMVDDYTSSYSSIYTWWNNPLPAGLIYYWRVRSRNNYGWSYWSSTFYYITGGPNGISSIDDAESKLSIFPNPNSGIFNLLFTNAEIGEYSIRVFDMTGRIVDYRVGNSTASEISEDFSIDNLAEGVYVIVLSEKGKTYTTRFNKL